MFARQRRDGHGARGHRADRAAGVGPGLGRPLGPTSGACWRASRRSSPASSPTPTPRSAGSCPRSRRSARWTTRWSWSSPTTAPAPRAARPAASTSTASPRTSGSRWPTTWPTTTTGAASAPTTTTRGPGPGPATRPHKLWKRYTWLGGTRTPLIVHWPGRIAQPGAVRPPVRPRHRPHADDPGAAGLEIPDEVDGVAQQPVDGVSLLPALEDPAPPEVHQTQYFEMMGSRSIYHDGWKATTNHISTGILDEEELAVGSRDFDEDRWELFDLTVDFSESTDRADERAGAAAAPARPVGRRGATATTSSPSPTASSTASAASSRRPGRPGTSRTFRPGGGAGGRRVGAASVGRLRHHGRHRHRPGRGRRRRCSPSATGSVATPSTSSAGGAHFTFARAADVLELATPSALAAGPPRDHRLLRGR